MHIGGGDVKTDTPLRVELPYDGSEVGTVYRAQREQVDAAVQAARAAGAAMREMTRDERSVILRRVHEAMLERRDALASAIVSECGKPIREGRLEVRQVRARVVTLNLVPGGREDLRVEFGGLHGLLLEGGDFMIRALTVLAISLSIQTALLGVWLALRDRAAFAGSLMVWRKSLGVGFLGAVASGCWFIAFALTPAANVRTLGLIEMPLAALLARRLTGKATSRHELAGMVIVMAGVALLLTSLAA